MKSKDLVNLIFSPVWMSTLLHYFLSGVQQHNPQGIKTELLYLVIPFVIDDVTRKRLTTANTKSTVASIFYKKNEPEDAELEMKNSLFCKNDQAGQYREITNRGLIYLSNVESLVINEFTVVGKAICLDNEKGIRRDFCKAAYYLGVILAKEDYRNAFVKLRITAI